MLLKHWCVCTVLSGLILLLNVVKYSGTSKLRWKSFCFCRVADILKRLVLPSFFLLFFFGNSIEILQNVTLFFVNCSID